MTEQVKYKVQKELFVSGHTGTSTLEVLVVLTQFPCFLFLTGKVVELLRSKQALTEDAKHNFRVLWVTEFIVLIIPLILSCTLLPTLYTESVTEFSTTLLVLTFVLLGVINVSAAPTETQNLRIPQQHSAVRDAEITKFRSTTMLYTLLCIVAVDFPVFPRRLAKTETFGISLMDVGVGLFIVSSALSVSMKLIASPTIQLKTVPKLARKLLPLLTLGILRTMSVKNMEYQEHASEYGVHLNFFFTLAGVFCLHYHFDCFLDLLASAKTSKNLAIDMAENAYLASGILVLLLYQLSLSFLGLETWIMTAPRVSLISQNKEGSFILSPSYVVV